MARRYGRDDLRVIEVLTIRRPTSLRDDTAVGVLKLRRGGDVGTNGFRLFFGLLKISLSNERARR